MGDFKGTASGARVPLCTSVSSDLLDVLLAPVHPVFADLRPSIFCSSIRCLVCWGLGCTLLHTLPTLQHPPAPYPLLFFLLTWIAAQSTFYRCTSLAHLLTCLCHSFAANRAPRANNVRAPSGPASPLLRAPSSPPAVALVCPSSHIVPLSYTRTPTNPSHAAVQTAVCPAISVNPFSCIALRPAYIAHACLASSLGFDEPSRTSTPSFDSAPRQATGDLDLTYVRGTLHLVYRLLVNIESWQQSCRHRVVNVPERREPGAIIYDSRHRRTNKLFTI